MTVASSRTSWHVAATPASLTLAAVLVTGATAGRLVSPALYATTALAALLVWRGTRERPTDDGHTDNLAYLPKDLSSRVSEALDHCGEGDARRLLLAVVAQARPLFTRNRAQLDEAAERQTIENVSSLIDACCATAESLANLDHAMNASRASADVAARANEMRRRLSGQLAGAATSLGNLYLAGLEHETDALSRVSELTTAIQEDAVARQAATEELRRVLTQ